MYVAVPVNQIILCVLTFSPQTAWRLWMECFDREVKPSGVQHKQKEIIRKKRRMDATHVFHASNTNTGRVAGTKLTLKVLKDPSNASVSAAVKN